MATSESSREVCLCSALRRATREATRFYDEGLKESGLKVTQFSLLRNIARAGSITVTELARCLDLERTAMGRNLDLLERRGLIRTTSGDDGRARVVALTKKGRAAEASARPAWRRTQAEMRRRLAEGSLASLGVVLTEMRQA